MSACACALALMLVTINGVPQKPIEFSTKSACEKAKSPIISSYKSSERRYVALKCIDK